MFRSFFTLLVLSAIAVQLAALADAQFVSAAPQDREVLTPVTSCEPDERRHQCDVWGLVWAGSGATAPIQRTLQGKRVIKSFLLTGVLNGGPPRPYALKFSQPLDDYFASTNRSGPIASVLNADDATIVRTDRGELRILSKFVREPIPNIVVVDNPSQAVVARYYSPCIDLSFLKRRTPFWDDGRGRCVSVRRDGRATAFAGTCAKPKEVAPVTCAYERMFSGFTAVRPVGEQIDAVARDMRPLGLYGFGDADMELGGGGWGVRTYRVEGTRFLVIWGRCKDCY
ncbi:MAG: hypothetical protein ACKVRO_08675 [Micropepsaceae bacterium]